MNQSVDPKRTMVGTSSVPHPADPYFTIVVIPDTQEYIATNPDPFHAQTRWIASVQAQERIAVVFHVGDLVAGPTAEEEQYQRAARALQRLDEADVPYLMTIGNHDYTEVASRNADDFESHFPASRFETRDWWRGCFRETAYNAAGAVQVGDENLLALSLELFPRTEVIEWANQTIEANPDHRVAFVTHGYLYNDGTRLSKGDKWTRQTYDLSGHNGDELWDAFVSQRPEIDLVFSGHALIGGNAHLLTPNDAGTAVHQLLTNYQSLEDGGRGYLTLVRIYPTTKAVTVETYSPWLDQFHPHSGLHYRIDGAFGEVGPRSMGRFVGWSERI